MNGDTRPYDDVRADAIRVFSEVARIHLDDNRIDFGEFVILAVAATAANVGGIEALLAGRPGSWEADYVRQMLHSTFGVDEQRLFEHRTEPLVVVVRVDNILNDIGYAALYDNAEMELSRREMAVAGDGEVTDEQEAEFDRLAQLSERLDQLRISDWTAFGDTFKTNVLAAAGELYPTLPVPVEVTIALEWSGADDDADGDGWWGPEEHLLSIAHERTPLPGSDVPLADYPNIADVAGTERAAGRDPLTRLAAG